MSFVSFLNDLGIIPNENTGLEKDPNLLQGQEYMEYERLYANAVRPHLKLLEITSSPSLKSIVESLNDEDSTSASSTTSNVSMSSIEKEFNRTLVKYSVAYKNFSENVIKDKSKKEIQVYFDNLQRLNNKLIALAKALGKELDDILLTDDQLKSNLDKQQQKLNSYISVLDQDRKKMQNVNKGYNTIAGEHESTKLQLVSNQYNYIVWLLLAITVVGVTIHIVTSNSVSNNKGNVLLIISLIALFLIVRNIYNTYSA